MKATTVGVASSFTNSIQMLLPMESPLLYCFVFFCLHCEGLPSKLTVSKTNMNENKTRFCYQTRACLVGKTLVLTSYWWNNLTICWFQLQSVTYHFCEKTGSWTLSNSNDLSFNLQSELLLTPLKAASACWAALLTWKEFRNHFTWV